MRPGQDNKGREGLYTRPTVRRLQRDKAGKRAARLYLRGAGVRQESRSPHEASSGGTGPVELPGEANHGAVAERTAQSKQSSGSRSCEKSERNAALVGQMGQTRWSRIIVASGHSLQQIAPRESRAIGTSSTQGSPSTDVNDSGCPRDHQQVSTIDTQQSIAIAASYRNHRLCDFSCLSTPIP